MPATYRMLVDWLDNGFGDTPRDDVTGRMLDQRSPVSVRYGRDQARQFAPTSPGELRGEIDNRSRDYSPENTASPLAGFVAPGRRVALEATTAGVTTTIYTGRTDDMDIRPGINDQSVPIVCVDALGALRGVKISTPLYRGVRTGTAIGYLLDAAGWPAADRDLDSGASYLPYWYLDDADAFEALMQLADSEGPPALVTVDPAGRIVFRDRHHRLTRSASLSSQATWRSSGVEPCISDPVTYDHGFKEIVNTISVEVPLRTVDPLLSQVWTSQGQITIGAGESLTITAKASAPFLGAITPEENTDYTLVSGAVTISLSTDSGQSTIITIAASSAAIVQDLALRAYTIQQTSITVTVEDAESVAKYGRRSLSDGRLPVWANQYDAEAILQLIIAKRAERTPTISVTMRGAGGPLRLAQCLTRDLSDRIHLTEALTGLDADCFIEQIQHTIGHGGAEHVTVFGLEKAPVIVTNPFTFNVAGKGFNDGVFLGGGLDDPESMFRFDTAGQGFNDGVFSN